MEASNRALFIASLDQAEAALREGDFDAARSLLPNEALVLEMEETGQDALVNRFYVAHAVATDRYADPGRGFGD